MELLLAFSGSWYNAPAATLLLGNKTPCGDPVHGLALLRGAQSCDGSGWRDLARADAAPSQPRSIQPWDWQLGGV